MLTRIFCKKGTWLLRVYASLAEELHEGGFHKQKAGFFGELIPTQSGPFPWTEEMHHKSPISLFFFAPNSSNEMGI